MKSLKNVPLTVNFSRIDLIEEGHHDEGVENYCEVLSGDGVEPRVSATVDVEHFISCCGGLFDVIFIYYCYYYSPFVIYLLLPLRKIIDYHTLKVIHAPKTTHGHYISVDEMR